MKAVCAGLRLLRSRRRTCRRESSVGIVNMKYLREKVKRNGMMEFVYWCLKISQIERREN